MKHFAMFSVALLLVTTVVFADVPQVISYQGRLTDSLGQPVTDGPYQLEFTIWDDSDSSPPENQLWSSGQQTVEVAGGLFTYLLGSTVQLPDTLWASDTLRWLGIQVGSDSEISPRTKLTSVAYAYHALRADITKGVTLTPTASPEPCGVDREGSIYYDDYLNELCYCDGTAWVQVDGGGNCLCEDEDDDGYDTCDPENPHDTDGQPADCDDSALEINPGAAELCDGLDNDCDQAVDEGNPEGGGSCNTGQQGECAGGTLECQAGALVCVPDVDPSPEICDGLDNDCDGAVDEGNPEGGGSCNTGQQGECAGGTLQCQAGALVCVQDVQPSPEICDGLDNDCDGVIDEGNPGGGGSCSTGQQGECAGGTLQCQAGALVCVQDVQPSPEICDGLDNDCDGVIDEGNPGGGGSCSTGQQGVCADGTLQCQAGALVCVPDMDPSPEICDGLDNDCDGVIDEGNPGGGGSCSTGQQGVCADGTLQCQAGALVCVQDVQPSPEICDGLDNDCDGTVDEGNPGGGGPCSTGLPGVCADGTLQCQAGALVCVPDVDPSPEICDGLDNDCDGAVDEGVCRAAPGDLVITEVMVNGSSLPDTEGQWFEVRNVSAYTINMRGLNLSSSTHAHQIDLDLFVPPGGTLTLANSTALEFAPDYIYGGVNLDNSSDILSLRDGAKDIDAVRYNVGAGWPIESGVSMSLSPNSIDAAQNDSVSNWCLSASRVSSGDYATPGKENDDCK